MINPNSTIESPFEALSRAEKFTQLLLQEIDETAAAMQMGKRMLANLRGTGGLGSLARSELFPSQASKNTHGDSDLLYSPQDAWEAYWNPPASMGAFPRPRDMQLGERFGYKFGALGNELFRELALEGALKSAPLQFNVPPPATADDPSLDPSQKRDPIFRDDHFEHSIDFDRAPSAGRSNAPAAGPEEAAERTKKAEEEIRASHSRISESAKHHIRGLGAGAFDAYADAMDNAIATGKFSSEAFGRALQNVLATTLRGIGQESAIKGAFQIAEGIGAAASGSPGAAVHFASAAKYFAVAAAAGAAAGAVSVSPGGQGGRGGGGGGRDSGREVVQNVTVIGALDSGARAALARQLREEIEQGDG